PRIPSSHLALAPALAAPRLHRLSSLAMPRVRCLVPYVSCWTASVVERAKPLLGTARRNCAAPVPMGDPACGLKTGDQSNGRTGVHPARLPRESAVIWLIVPRPLHHGIRSAAAPATSMFRTSER